MLYLWANGNLLRKFTIVIFIYYISLPSCTILEKFLMWVPRMIPIPIKMYEEFLAQFRINMSHLDAKRSFLCNIHYLVKFKIICNISPLFTNNALSCFKNSKIFDTKLTHGKNDPYWITGIFFPKNELRQFFLKHRK